MNNGRRPNNLNSQSAISFGTSPRLRSTPFVRTTSTTTKNHLGDILAKSWKLTYHWQLTSVSKLDGVEKAIVKLTVWFEVLYRKSKTELWCCQYNVLSRAKCWQHNCPNRLVALGPASVSASPSWGQTARRLRVDTCTQSCPGCHSMPLLPFQTSALTAILSPIHSAQPARVPAVLTPLHQGCSALTARNNTAALTIRLRWCNCRFCSVGSGFDVLLFWSFLLFP